MPIGCKGIGGIRDLLHQRFGQLALRVTGVFEAFAELSAEEAEFFDAGDDAVLLGEGRQWKGAMP